MRMRVDYRHRRATLILLLSKRQSPTARAVRKRTCTIVGYINVIIPISQLKAIRLPEISYHTDNLCARQPASYCARHAKVSALERRGADRVGVHLTSLCGCTASRWTGKNTHADTYTIINISSRAHNSGKLNKYGCLNVYTALCVRM